MKVNTNQTINCYTQGQQGIASILLTVWLLASVSLESALAAPKGEEATRSETTTSPPGQLASPSSRPVVEETEYACPAKDPGRSLSRYARRYATTDDTAPLLGQLPEDQDSFLSQNAQDNLATVDDTTLQLLHQAAKEQDPTLRQASAYALANLATADEKTLQLLHKAAKEQDDDVREIALAALKTLKPAPSTSHTDKKQVLQKFFKQAVETNDVPRLTKLILENTDEVGELCESLAVDRLIEILPQTADILLTWGVTHNKYELVEFIIKRGRQHITNNRRECVGQSATKIAAQKGYRKLFLLLINNGVDVDTRNITAFMSAIIGSEYELAQAMIGLGEYRLEEPDKNGDTPQGCLDRNRSLLQIFGEEKLRQQAKVLEELLYQKVQPMNESNPKEGQQALLKKEQ